MSNAIEFLLFYANYGFESSAYYESEINKNLAQTVQLKIKQLKALYKQLIQNMKFVAYRMAKYYDNGKLSEPIFKKKRDKVFLV